MSGYNNNPLGDRGKAQEDQWAREQDRQRIEEMKGKAGSGKPEPGKDNSDGKSAAPDSSVTN